MISYLSKLFGGGGKEIPGNLVQYPDSSRRSGKIQLVIGLDFGTAFTKVVIAERRQAYAVPFAGANSSGANPYLLSGILSIGQGNCVQLGEQRGARHVADLKMRILNRDTGDEARSVTASFLALVLQHSRAWFLSAHRATYKNFELDWYINVGLPTEHYHDTDLVNFYRQIVRAAWMASTRPDPLDIDAVEQCLNISSEKSEDHHIGLFPEFAAQINGYVRSSMRMHDLHLLVDIGAGTVDVALFNVHEKDGEDVFPIFAKSVESRGVHFMHRHRVQHGLGGDGPPPAFREGQSEVEAASALSVTTSRLHAIDASFMDSLREQIGRDVRLTKDRYPLSKHWEVGVPFFLCGGGAKFKPYADFAARLVRDRYPCRLRRVELPKPQKLVAAGMPDGSYERLSVAYGLSFDPFDIGEIIRSDQIVDDGAHAPRSMMCPRCGGTGGGMANSCDRCGGRGWLT